MAKNPDTEPYKGVRDFYPEEQFIQNYITGVWQDIASSFGYQEYNASILEPTDLYVAKTSKEIVEKQTYTFTDRGDRSVTLRPEMTPSVARMIARKHRELSFPLRWFSVGNMFRYERPQRGRMREHWQLNADIFGVTGTAADAEIVQLAHEILTQFGAQENEFVIKVNNRGILRAHLMDAKGLSEEETEQELSLMDKGASKMNIETLKPDESITELIEKLAAVGITNVEYDQTIIRGFSYYTGMVFEVFDSSAKNNRSIFGGGRYDGLVEAYGGPATPAVGVAMGDITTRDFLQTHDLLPSYRPRTQLHICLTDMAQHSNALELADTLRHEGLSISVDISGKKVGEQISYADKHSIPFILCIGDKEVESKRYTVKELATGKETELTKDKIADSILKKLDASS